jgi:hypothetical protein
LRRGRYRSVAGAGISGSFEVSLKLMELFDLLTVIILIDPQGPKDQQEKSDHKSQISAYTHLLRFRVDHAIRISQDLRYFSLVAFNAKYPLVAEVWIP